MWKTFVSITLAGAASGDVCTSMHRFDLNPLAVSACSEGLFVLDGVIPHITFSPPSFFFYDVIFFSSFLTKR